MWGSVRLDGFGFRTGLWGELRFLQRGRCGCGEAVSGIKVVFQKGKKLENEK